MAVNLGDITSIQEHLNAYEGVDEENVLSDIEELGRRDPTLFTGPLGEDAQLYLDDAKRQIAAGQKNEASASLDKVLDLLEGKLRAVGGKRRRRKTRKARRGRKSRRKSLRQRK